MGNKKLNNVLSPSTTDTTTRPYQRRRSLAIVRNNSFRNVGSGAFLDLYVGLCRICLLFYNM